ncbi:MAG: hypothetical protein WAO52_04000 [Prolixibacteraceae bacterium]
MFFLGLLSTPMPYLLLAAFYFFGFAMGMFNNSSGDEVAEVSAVTIPAEVSPKINTDFTYFYQINPEINQAQAEDIKIEYTPLSLFPDTGQINYFVRSTKVNEFLFPGFIFSRPPPSAC